MYVHKRYLLFYCCLFGKSLECYRGFLSLILLIALLNRKRDKHVSPFQTNEIINFDEGQEYYQWAYIVTMGQK